MNYFYITIALISGTLLPLQALINSRLGATMGGPLWAATISFIVGTIGLIFLLIIGRHPIPSFENAGSLPLWAWTGGLLGAFFVASSVVAVKPLGTATMVSLVIFGQMVAALLYDHFGVLQTPSPITPIKIFGAACLMLGVYIIMNK